MTADDDGVGILLGAYVLGGLDAVDRRQVKDHLPHCPECCAELVDLAALPALLRRISTDEAADVERTGGRGAAPATDGGAVPYSVNDERRPRRRGPRIARAAAGVAAAVVVAGAMRWRRQRAAVPREGVRSSQFLHRRRAQ